MADRGNDSVATKEESKDLSTHVVSVCLFFRAPFCVSVCLSVCPSVRLCMIRSVADVVGIAERSEPRGLGAA